MSSYFITFFMKKLFWWLRFFTKNNEGWMRSNISSYALTLTFYLNQVLSFFFSILLSNRDLKLPHFKKFMAMFCHLLQCARHEAHVTCTFFFMHKDNVFNIKKRSKWSLRSTVKINSYRSNVTSSRLVVWIKLANLIC